MGALSGRGALSEENASVIFSCRDTSLSTMSKKQVCLLLCKKHKNTGAGLMPTVQPKALLAGPLQAVLTSPPQNCKIVIDSCLGTCAAVPRAAVLAQLLQNAEVAALGSCTADFWAPGTAILVGKLQHCQVASSPAASHVLELQAQPCRRA